MRYLVTIFSIIVVNLTLVCACGHKDENHPPTPCNTGVNLSTCGVGVSDHSQWMNQFTTSEADAQTQKPIPGTEHLIQVTYEFAPSEALPTFRRTMVITSASGKVSTFEQGDLVSMTNNELSFTKKKTSCDDNVRVSDSDNFKLYYKRQANTLQLDTVPIVDMKASSTSQAIGNVIGQVVTGMIRITLETVFSFGNAKAYLTSGHGTFNASNTPILAQDIGEVGCFNAFGLPFSHSKIKPDW